MRTAHPAALAVFSGLLLVSSGAGAAADPLKTSLNLGLSLTDGNSETTLANLGLLAEGEKEKLGSFRAGVEGNYGENTVRRTVLENGEAREEKETTTTVENVKVFANARKTLDKRFFAYGDTTALYDDIAEIDYRVVFGPGLGMYLVKNEATSISVEAGPAYILEDVSGVRDDFLSLRFSERFEHAFNERARLWQSIEYLPKSDDLGVCLVNAEIGAEAALNASLNLRVTIQEKYDSDPGEGLEKNDVSLIAGVSVVL